LEGNTRPDSSGLRLEWQTIGFTAEDFSSVPVSRATAAGCVFDVTRM
jgi:hypothetical protein